MKWWESQGASVSWRLTNISSKLTDKIMSYNHAFLQEKWSPIYMINMTARVQQADSSDCPQPQNLKACYWFVGSASEFSRVIRWSFTSSTGITAFAVNVRSEKDADQHIRVKLGYGT
jgi:hypothetical protein